MFWWLLALTLLVLYMFKKMMDFRKWLYDFWQSVVAKVSNCCPPKQGDPTWPPPQPPDFP